MRFIIMESVGKSRKFMADSMRKVNTLIDFELSEDVPAIQAANCSLAFHSNMNTNFNDITAFKSSFARPAEDARVCAQLNIFLDMGQKYAAMLYSWRSVSRAIPVNSTNGHPHRPEIYQKTFDILEPHAKKLKEFYVFQNTAIRRLVEEMRRLAHMEQKNLIVSKALLVTFGKMLKMLVVLDELKSMKPSIRNDFCHYKRAVQLRQNVDRDITVSQEISVFLANNRIICETLKEALKSIDGYEDLLIEIIHISAQMYDDRAYLLPSEKHELVIIIAFSFFLLDSGYIADGKQRGVNLKIFKRLNIPKLDRILKECEVVILFGDMHLVPYSYIRQTATFDPSKWPECQSSRVSSQGALLMHMSRFREEYTSLTSDLAWHTNLTATRISERSSKDSREQYALALRALQYLSGWSVQVLDTFTWKMANRASPETNKDCPEDALDYEKATKYNYSSEERFAMIEVISMIKSVQAQMLYSEPHYSKAIQLNIYCTLQSIVVGQLNVPLVKAQKKQKDKIHLIRLIHAIRATCADSLLDQFESECLNQSGCGGSNLSRSHLKSWRKSMRPKLSSAGRNNNSLVTGSNSTLAAVAASLINEGGDSPASLAMFDPNSRHVGPSSTQLYLVRAMLELMVDQMRKDLDATTLGAMEGLLKNSFYWPYLLNLSESLEACCDLSQLWYREFFLELAQNTHRQFPISMSLPWIFTDHILKTEHPAFMEYVLYPLDLYNDAAASALNCFRRQFLYDEIEAEANFVVEQLVYKLSDQVFRHYKCLASSILLDKRFRAEAHRSSWHEDYPRPNRYAAALLRQSNVHLLGRTIDLSRLISQRVNKSIFLSLEVAVTKFQGSDLTGIVELEAMIECNRLCHRMLKKYIDLDDFDSLLREVNNMVSSSLGKITIHVFWELAYDLVKNYCYNDATNRFVRTKLSLSEVLEREKLSPVEPHYLWGSRSLNACYNAIFKLYRGFIGPQHFSSICRLLGYRGLHIIVTEILKIAQSLMSQTLRDYVCRLARLMPSSLVLPAASQGSDVTFSSLYSQLRPIYQFSDLRTTIFQNFKELGNIILICLQLEKSQSVNDLGDLRHAGPFIGQLPKPHSLQMPIPEGSQSKSGQDLRRERDLQVKEYLRQQEALNLVNVAARIGDADQLKLAKENETLTKERLCAGLVIVEHVLNCIRDFLCQEDSGEFTWLSLPQTSNHNPTTDYLGLQSCSQFHKIWSAVQLVFCTPSGRNEYTVEEMFGEGLNWGGCLVILLLGQQRRFELLDFGGHLLRLQNDDKKDTTPEGVSLEKVARRLEHFSVLNRHIFSILNVYLRPKDRPSDSNERVRHFPPPAWIRQ